MGGPLPSMIRDSAVPSASFREPKLSCFRQRTHLPAICDCGHGVDAPTAGQRLRTLWNAFALSQEIPAEVERDERGQPDERT